MALAARPQQLKLGLKRRQWPRAARVNIRVTRFGLSRAIIVSEFIDGSKTCRCQPRFGRAIVSHREKPFPQIGNRHAEDLIRACPIHRRTLAYSGMPDGGMENAGKGLALHGMATNKDQHAVRI